MAKIYNNTEVNLMRYLKEIEPYNKFWGNCTTNMFLSILQKKHPSYEPLIYLNAYEYSRENIFHINYTQQYYDYFNNFIFFECCNFNNKKEFLSEFKNILINNSYVTINVDLFYWNKLGAYYNNIHKSHSSLVIGFDEEADIFYALEDDTNLNYAIREISTDSLIQAFLSDYKDRSEDYMIISIKESEIKPYTLNKSDVLLNAKRIISDIEDFIENKNIVDKDLLLADISNAYFYGNEFGNISYRLLGNVLLFETMRDNGMLGGILTSELIACINELSSKWKLAQNIFLKRCLSNKILDVDSVEEMIIDLFIKEKNLWLKLIEL